VQKPAKVTDAKILIVDDTVFNIFVLRKVLKQVFNLRADGAESG
jgi:PleD family two-component response regulator